MIGAGTLFVTTFAPQTLSEVQRIILPFIAQPDAIPTDLHHLRRIILSMFGDLLMATLLPLSVVVVAAIASGFVQHGFVVSADSIMPKLEKIRSEERRVGKEGVSTCRSRWWQDLKKKKK